MKRVYHHHCSKKMINLNQFHAESLRGIGFFSLALFYIRNFCGKGNKRIHTKYRCFTVERVDIIYIRKILYFTQFRNRGFGIISNLFIDFGTDSCEICDSCSLYRFIGDVTQNPVHSQAIRGMRGEFVAHSEYSKKVNLGAQ